MKRFHYVLALLSAIALSACVPSFSINWPTGGGGASSASMSSRKVKAYDLITLGEENPDEGSTPAIDNYSIGTIDLYFVTGREDVPYISLKGYRNLIDLELNADCRSDFRQQSYQQSVTVYQGDTPRYQIIIDYSTRQLLVGGSIHGLTTYTPDYGQSTIGLWGVTTSESFDEGDGYATYSFADFSSTLYSYQNEFYVPFGFMDLLLGVDIGYAHFYGETGLYRYNDASLLARSFSLEGTATNAVSAIAERHARLGAMPESSRILDRDCLYYVLQNYYGLKSRKFNGRTVEAYARSQGVHNDLVSSSDTVRMQALYDMLGRALDDDHTGLGNIASWCGENIDDLIRIRGTHSRARAAARDELGQAFAAHLEENGLAEADIEYSADNSLARISFKSFTIAMNAYDEYGNLRDDLIVEDTFAFLYDRLIRVKESGVKNVLLDISLNVGGYVAVMQKLLALISKENSADIYYKSEQPYAVYRQNTKLDSNGDGKCDLDDVFGDDLNFYILESQCSFSCGNAFPFYAKSQGLAKLVGEKSGGGECTVGSAFLPSGHVFSFSSLLHIGNASKAGQTVTFEGDEDGASPDIPLSYDSFYDLDAIASRIAQ